MIDYSLLKPISIGVVAKDILEDEVYVDIWPVELQPGVDGEVSEIQEHNNSITDMYGNISNIKVVQSDLITAKWLPYGDTNRLEPPTVCKGEIVQLYRYSDSDQYFWTTLYNQLDLRKLEKRTIVVSNKASINISQEELLNHSYYITMDSINKIVKLRTSDTDGEYTTYDITIDTKEGMLEIIDGKDNQIWLESQDDRLTVKINKEIITETTDRSDHQTNNHNIHTDNDRNLTVGNNVTEHIGSNKKTSIGQRYDISLKSYSVNNGADELVHLMAEFVQAVHDAIGIGNLGMPVPMDDGTKAKLQDIKSRFGGFF